ncbi:MAG: glycosyltransferase family 39 protein [Clostridia bacterium]|nr:glycosyltransferase family 39 protein [Clostridia bacterium]
MAEFLNPFGSVLLILAGICVLIAFLKENLKPTTTKNNSKKSHRTQLPTTSHKINYKVWIRVGILAIALRWWIYLFSFSLLDTDQSFWEVIGKIFSVSGDSPHYLYLAEHGYTAVGDKANLIVFYPLYPLLIKIFNVVFNDYFISGVVVSNLAFALASCVFYELLRLDYQKENAFGGLLLMMIAPFSMFYCAIFTESVFLLTTVLCLYFMRIKKPMWMGICGFLACLSRTQGIILFVCALVPVASSLLKEKKFNLKEFLWALLIPLGFFVYLLMNQILFGNWFQYLEFQAAPPWYNKAQWFGETLTYSYNMAKAYPGLAKFIYHPQLILFFAGTLSIFWGIYKKVRTEYLVYLGAYIVTCYTHGWLISGSRYMCACLPLFIVYSSVKNKYIRYAILVISFMFCIMYTRLWLNGESIM